MKNGKAETVTELTDSFKTPVGLSEFIYLNNPNSFFLAVKKFIYGNQYYMGIYGKDFTAHKTPATSDFQKCINDWDLILKTYMPATATDVPATTNPAGLNAIKKSDIDTILSSVVFNKSAGNFTASQNLWATIGVRYGDIPALVTKYSN